MARTGVRPVAVDLLPHLRRVRDHIDRCYREPLCLDQLVRVARVSKFHLVRSFEAAYGRTSSWSKSAAIADLPLQDNVQDNVREG